MIESMGRWLKRLTPNTGLLIWLTFIALVALLGLQQWQAGARLQSDILAMLPQVVEDPLTDRASLRVESQLANRVYLALIADDKTRAVAAAKQVMASLQQDERGAFSDIESADMAQGEALSDFYFKHRFQLLTPEQARLLAEGQWQRLAKQAQQKLYNAFSYANSALIAHDPLLLYPDNLLALAPRQKLVVQQGILLAPLADTPQPTTGRVAAIVMAKGVQSVFSPDAQLSQLAALEAALDKVSQQDADIQILEAGALFHAAAATQSARQEVSTIGLVSLVGVILLVWLAFRSMMPLAIALLTISSSLLLAIVSTLIFFGELHLLTLVFGTSLIGISIDYCFHFYCERLQRPALSAVQIVGKISPAISLALITSVAAYACIGLAPFPGMQQVAVFCAAGLIGAYVTLLFAYPKLAASPLPAGEKSLALARGYQNRLLNRVNPGRGQAFTLAIGVLLFAATVVGLLRLSSNDDIRQLQHTPADIMQQENALRTLLSGGTDNQFLLVRGDSEESLRQHLESLEPVLAQAKRNRLIGNSLSLSHFLPSQRRQAENYRLQSEIYLSHLDEAIQIVGLNNELKSALVASYSAAEQDYITAEDFLASEAGKALRPLWLAPERGGEYGAIVLLGGITDIDALSRLVGDSSQVRLVDKVADISRVMGHYRQLTLGLLAIALVVAALVFTTRFGLKLAAVVIAVPALAALFTLAALGLSGSALSLFHALALILVFGIGVDYSLFFAEARQDSDGVMLAVFMSACSTLLAFGLLAFSQTPAISAFGLTLLLGIGFTFALSPLIQIYTRKIN